MSRLLAVGVVFAARASAAHKNAIANILGRGWDATQADFWTWGQSYSSAVFADETPSECYEESPCRHVSSTESQTFNSITSWQQYVEESFQTTVSPSGGFLGTLAASVEMRSASNWTDDKVSFFFKAYNRQMCYQMRSDCVANSTNLHPDVKSSLGSLPKSGTDATTMEEWVQNFVKQFGTHTNVGSQHGASIKLLNSVESQCEYSAACLQQNACVNMSYVAQFGGDVCNNPSTCTHVLSSCSDLMKSSCVVSGGDPSVVATNLCAKDTPTSDLSAFLDSGDMTSGSSAIHYDLSPISDVLQFMGYSDESAMLTKASEYHACLSPRFSWVDLGSGEYGCQCALQCENGGTLDEQACTCTCVGDEDHGWTGSTCASTYGHCVAGAGNGLPSAGTTCEQTNVCASKLHSHECDVTEVCCMSDMDGKCCPYGNSCYCPFLGGTCDCVAPSDIDSVSLV